MAPPRWLRSPFLAEMVRLGCFLALGVVIITLAFDHFVQRPRAQMLAGMFAAQLASISAATSQLPRGSRDGYLARLEGLSGGNIVVDDPTAWTLVEPDASLARHFLHEVRLRLPGLRVAFSDAPSLQLWAEIVVDGNRRRWLRIPLSRFATTPPGILLAGGVALILLTIGGTSYLVAQSRRKLRWLGAAIDQIGADPFPVAAPLAPVAQDDTDLAALRLRFNEMSARLADAHADRALMLAGVSHDMRTLLTKLRLCLVFDPATSALTVPIRYIEQMDRIIGQFVEFARPVDEEPASLLDLNAVVDDVAADIAPAAGQLALALGVVPVCLLRPLAVRRMAMNLLENAVRHGGGAIEVSTAQEGAMLVLRVRDRGPGVSAHELENLGRPFFRTAAARGRSPGSGLGLAISRRMAEAQGGSLLLARRDGGGFQAEIRLPLRGAVAGL